MAINNTAEVTLNINSQNAKARLDELQKQATNLSAALKAAYESGDKKGAMPIARELRKVNREITNIQRSSENLNVAMNSIATATPKQLNNLLKQINKELSSGNVQRGSAEWKAYNQQIIKVKAELAKINAEQKAAVPLVNRLGEAFNRVQGIALGITAAFAGVVTGINRMRKFRNEKDTARANLKAITGLDDESIDWMQKQAEDLSRTMDSTGLRIQQSSAEILEAFKNVGAAKPELLSNKEAMRDVTVEAMRLAQAAGISLKDAVEGVTISLNEYGASSDDATKYVNVLAAGSRNGAAGVENINKAVIRAGVAAAKAGIPIEQLVASTEVLAGKGIIGRIAGTGLKTFFLKLATGADDTNPKIVGLTKALYNLKKQGLTEKEFVQRFGLEAYNAASVLVDNIDALKKMEKAVTNTNMAVEQAAIVGQTYEARAAQLGNQLKEIGQEIYKDIQPIVTLFMSKSTYVLKAVRAILYVLKEYGGTIISLITPIAAYNVAIATTNALHSKGVTAIVRYTKALFSMSTITRAATAAKYALASATLLFTGNIKKAAVAFKAFSHVLKLNPIGLLATAIAGVIVAIVKLTKKEKELTIAQKKRQAVQEMFRQIDEDVVQSTAKEIAKVKELTAIIHDNTLSQKRRQEAINDLRSILPEYYVELSEEGTIVNENTKAIETYIAALKKRGYINATNSKMTEVVGERMMAENDYNHHKVYVERLRQARDKYTEYVNTFVNRNGGTFEQAEKYLRNNGGVKSLQTSIGEEASQFLNNPIIGKNAWKELKKAEKELSEFEERLKIAKEKEDKLLNFLQEKIREEETTTPKTKTIPKGNGDDPDILNKQIDELEFRANKKRINNKQLFAEGNRYYKQYAYENLAIDRWLLDEKQKLYKKGSKEWVKLELEQYELDQQFNSLREELINQEADKQSQRLLADYAKHKITKEQYEDQLTEIEIDALYQRQNLYNKKQNEFWQIEDEINQKKREKQERNRERKATKAKEQWDDDVAYLELNAYTRGSEMTKNERLMLESDYWETLMQIYEQGSEQYKNAQKEFQRVERNIKAEKEREIHDAYNFFNQLTDRNPSKAQQDYEKGMYQVDIVRNDAKANGSEMPEEDYNKAKYALGQQLLDARMKEISEKTGISFIDTYKARYEAIENLEKQGIITHQQAEQAKVKATAEMLEQMRSIYESAWNNIDQILSASSNLIQANSDLETAKINANYEQQIEAAGKNSHKVQRLEKERDEKLREAKTRANEKAMRIQIAQAVAQTAIAALNAYSSTAAIPMVGPALAPIAAATAVATGAMQVAAIKKQHQAESIGYAQGGFTPKGKWDKPQGVVHSGEFVANRFAVSNKQILPALQLIDRAQRTNTIGSLTADDVTAALYSRTSPDVVSAVNSTQQPTNSQTQPDNGTAQAMLASANAINRTADVIDKLNRKLDDGITAYTTISGRSGIDEQTKKYNQLKNNAR